jgi:hypothetical protein
MLPAPSTAAPDVLNGVFVVLREPTDTDGVAPVLAVGPAPACRPAAVGLGTGTGSGVEPVTPGVETVTPGVETVTVATDVVTATVVLGTVTGTVAAGVVTVVPVGTVTVPVGVGTVVPVGTVTVSVAIGVDSVTVGSPISPGWLPASTFAPKKPAIATQTSAMTARRVTKRSGPHPPLVVPPQ